MALRAVPDHPKFMAFKTTLGLPKGAALGWIESIWHFASRFTPQGNIGKYSDRVIETWVEWDGIPGALIAALVECGWLDQSRPHRLIVHDWDQHADEFVHTELARKLLVFASGALPRTGRLNQAERERFKSAFSQTLVRQNQDNLPEESISGPERSMSRPEETHFTPKPEPSQSLAMPEPEPGGDAPPSPAMVAQGVLHECGVAGQHTRYALEGIVRSMAGKPGYSPDDALKQLVDAWNRYEAAKPKLKFTWGAEKFFADGHWRTPDAWPWRDDGAHSHRANEKLNSVKASYDAAEARIRDMGFEATGATGGSDGPDSVRRSGAAAGNDGSRPRAPSS